MVNASGRFFTPPPPQKKIETIRPEQTLYSAGLFAKGSDAIALPTLR